MCGCVGRVSGGGGRWWGCDRIASPTLSVDTSAPVMCADDTSAPVMCAGPQKPILGDTHSRASTLQIAPYHGEMSCDLLAALFGNKCVCVSPLTQGALQAKE